MLHMLDIDCCMRNKFQFHCHKKLFYNYEKNILNIFEKKDFIFKQFRHVQAQLTGVEDRFAAALHVRH
jgi:hypothetical protein